MSQGVITSELMLFEPKAINEGVEYLQYIECRPTNQITMMGQWISTSKRVGHSTWICKEVVCM